MLFFFRWSFCFTGFSRVNLVSIVFLWCNLTTVVLFIFLSFNDVSGMLLIL
jgi:hypothetical protein